MSGAGTYAQVDFWSTRTDLGCGNDAQLYCFSNQVVLFWDGFDLGGDTSRWSSVAP